MIYVLIEHYLSEGGKQYFPKWVDAVRDALKSQKGFLQLEQIKDMEDIDRSLLLLQFNTLENLQLWAKSEVHQTLLQNLQHYRIKKQQSQIYSNI